MRPAECSQPSPAFSLDYTVQALGLVADLASVGGSEVRALYALLADLPAACDLCGS